MNRAVSKCIHHCGFIHEGDRVRIFSRSANKWVTAEVLQLLDENFLRVEYTLDAYHCAKTMHVQSKHLDMCCCVETCCLGHVLDCRRSIPQEATCRPDSIEEERSFQVCVDFHTAVAEEADPGTHERPCNSSGILAQQLQSNRPFQGCRGSLPVDCGGDPRRYYVEFDYILTLLEEEEVVLIKGSWLLERRRAHRFEPLPCRQDLPPEALVDVGQLRRVAARLVPNCHHGILPIVSISHCWLDRNHPDPHGLLLEELAPAIEAYLAQAASWAGCIAELSNFEGAFFFAWCSIYQPYHCKVGGTYLRLENVQLTKNQQESHKNSLENMDIWYTHQYTEVWLLTKYCEGQGHPYHNRGWTTWERAVANILTESTDFVLDLGQLPEDKRRADMCEIRYFCKVARMPPYACDHFQVLIEAKHFTCGGTDLPLIRANYTRNFSHALACMRRANFAFAGWSCSEFAAFFNALRHCRNLAKLELYSNQLDDDAACKLAACLQHCHNLAEIDLGKNLISDVGTVALAKACAPRHCRSIRLLMMQDNKIGDIGVCALADGLSQCGSIEFLDLQLNQIGDPGAVGLADGLQHCHTLEEIWMYGNKLTDAGADRLFQGLQHCRVCV